jgi:hypothetical protein
MHVLSFKPIGWHYWRSKAVDSIIDLNGPLAGKLSVKIYHGEKGKSTSVLRIDMNFQVGDVGEECAGQKC